MTRFSSEHAWWLPKGSIRAVLAIIVIGAAVVVLTANNEYGLLAGMAVLAMNFYFLKDALGTTLSDRVGASNPIDPVDDEV